MNKLHLGSSHIFGTYILHRDSTQGAVGILEVAGKRVRIVATQHGEVSGLIPASVCREYGNLPEATTALFGA